MKTIQTCPAAIQHLIAYQIAEGVYRLTDHALAIVDGERNQAIVITMTEATTQKGKTTCLK